MKFSELEEQYAAWIADELSKNGFGDNAIEMSQTILAKAVHEAEKVNLRGMNAWEYFRGDADFVWKRTQAGLTDGDLQQYWDREYVLIVAEYEMLKAVDDSTRLSVYSLLVDQGYDKEQAVLTLRKMFAFFGDPDLSHPKFQGQDADIFPEIRARYEKWRSMHTPESVVEQSKVYSTRNAFIRDLAVKGEL